MSIEILDGRRVAALESAPLTYPPDLQVGVDRPGWDVLSESNTLRRNDFEALGWELFQWRFHERAGLRMRVSDVPLRVGSVTSMTVRVAGVPVRARCRVTEVIDEINRKGFSYGTLPGHPEVGIERFLLQRGPSGAVTFRVTATSRPSSVVGFLAGPVARRVQHRIVRRYLQAPDLLD